MDTGEEEDVEESSGDHDDEDIDADSNDDSEDWWLPIGLRLVYL